jgi:hypothetical protein
VSRALQKWKLTSVRRLRAACRSVGWGLCEMAIQHTAGLPFRDSRVACARVTARPMSRADPSPSFFAPTPIASLSPKGRRARNPPSDQNVLLVFCVLSRSWPPRVLASTRCPGQVRDSRSYTVYPKVHQPRSIVLHRLIVNQLACRQSYTAGAYISLLQSWCPTNATQVHCQHRSVRVASPTSDSRGLMVVWLGSRASTPAPLSHLPVCPPQVNFPLVVAVHQGVANRRRDETSKHLEMSASRSSPPLPDLVSIVFLFGPHAPIGSPWPCAIGSRGILCWPGCESRLRLTLNRGICALPYCIASSWAQYPSHITSDDKPAVATDRYARDRRIDALPIFFFSLPACGHTVPFV